MYPSQHSLHPKLEDILNLFSKAGISVVEFREYAFFVELVVREPISSELFDSLYQRLLKEYNLIMFQIRSEQPIVRILPLRQTESKLMKYRHVLTALSLLTIFMTGYGLAQGLNVVIGPLSMLEVLLNALLYTALFSAILIIHELGHLYISRKTGILVEGPVLIPAPPIQLGFLGTFGAIISARSPPSSRRNLAKMGLYGPLFGFVAATLAGVLGLYLSPTISSDIAADLAERGELTPVSISSLGIYLLIRLILHEPGITIVMHPVLFAAYVMYIITFINLLPIGQLDGGHVVRSTIGARAFHLVSTAVPVLMFSSSILLTLLGLDASYYTALGFITLILYLLVGRKGHPGVANQYDRSSCHYCVLAYIMLLILTTPIPITS